MAKFYTRIIDNSPAYKAIFLGLQNQMSPLEYGNLLQLHDKMSKFGAKRQDIL